MHWVTKSAPRSIAGAKNAVKITRVSLTRVCDAVFGARSLRMLMNPRYTGISYLQESITGKSSEVEGTGAQGPQGDTSYHKAVDEAHPEKISEFLRDQNRSITEGESK